MPRLNMIQLASEKAQAHVTWPRADITLEEYDRLTPLAGKVDVPAGWKLYESELREHTMHGLMQSLEALFHVVMVRRGARRVQILGRREHPMAVVAQYEIASEPEEGE